MCPGRPTNLTILSATVLWCFAFHFCVGIFIVSRIGTGSSRQRTLVFAISSLVMLLHLICIRYYMDISILWAKVTQYFPVSFCKTPKFPKVNVDLHLISIGNVALRRGPRFPYSGVILVVNIFRIPSRYTSVKEQRCFWYLCSWEQIHVHKCRGVRKYWAYS